MSKNQEEHQEQEAVDEPTANHSTENSEQAETEETTQKVDEAEQVAADPLVELQAQLDEMEDKFLRTQAELANMRNRYQKERETLLRYRSQDLAKELFPAVDNLERALAIEVSDEQGASLKKGIEMVLESLHHALKEAGITEIPALGQVFDPNRHQAVQTVPVAEGQQTDEIVQVLQKGYILYDRVLRPSMVIVAQ